MINAVRGTKDILPDEIPIWYRVEKTLREVSSTFCFKEIRLPIFEKTEVFSRSVGIDTDIVNKEMYTFLDRGGDSITLRPEMTASVVRAIIQNNLLNDSPILRLWYYGPLFRYERPQKGRLRQFHQYGAELVGSGEPEADVEIILLAKEIIEQIGIKEYTLLFNSIGNKNSRQKYRKELIRYFEAFSNKLSPESQERLKKNPLRILDSKDEKDREIINNCPKIYDFLDEESINHYKKVKELLLANNVHFEESPFLVRGLDYYTHTVFEFQSPLLGAQDSFGGGGRYNDLFSEFGYKKEIPATGFALGIERIILILSSIDNKFQNENPFVYIAVNKSEYYSKVFEIAQWLRKQNIPTLFDLQKKSLKAQLKEANKLNIKYVIIIGEEEINNNSITIKKMETGEQKNLEIFKGMNLLLNIFNQNGDF